MKRTVILTVILLLGLFPAMAREYVVSGPEGGLAMKVALPEGFDPAADRCPMVILMHGIFSSKDYNPIDGRGQSATGQELEGDILPLLPQELVHLPPQFVLAVLVLPPRLLDRPLHLTVELNGVVLLKSIFASSHVTSNRHRQCRQHILCQRPRK